MLVYAILMISVLYHTSPLKCTLPFRF